VLKPKNTNIGLEPLKGIVSRDSVSTETTDVKFRPKDCSAYLFYTCKVARQKYLMLQTGGLSM
jgi:hypothetical protein